MLPVLQRMLHKRVKQLAAEAQTVELRGRLEALHVARPHHAAREVLAAQAERGLQLPNEVAFDIEQGRIKLPAVPPRIPKRGS